MDVVHLKCAGLDVHAQTVVACARLGSGKAVAYDRRTFGTTTPELLALSDWLTAHGCTHVAMESSGIYWKPVWHVLDGHFELVLANAMHSATSPVARATSTTPPGSPTCSRTVSSGAASCRPRPCKSCAT